MQMQRKRLPKKWEEHNAAMSPSTGKTFLGIKNTLKRKGNVNGN